jgi:hypothetical protein
MVLSLEWCLGLQEKDDKFEWFEQGSKKGEKLGFWLEWAWNFMMLQEHVWVSSIVSFPTFWEYVYDLLDYYE